MARHPEVVEKLRAEILERVGLHGVPTYTDLKEMKYLQNVLRETLRIYPIGKKNPLSAMRLPFLTCRHIHSPNKFP